jgi:hypothetical protein
MTEFQIRYLKDQKAKKKSPWLLRPKKALSQTTTPKCLSPVNEFKGTLKYSPSVTK